MHLPKRGTYTGRLAFDPDTGFHIDPKGRRVVTDDGKTWRYAKRGDLSHNARHGRVIVAVDTTENALAALAVKIGLEQAHAQLRAEQPHHYEVQTADGHYNLQAPNLTTLKVHTDAEAPTQTSHTEAWQ